MGSDWSEWLASLQGFGSQKMEDIGALPFVAVMLISLLSAMFIAFLYRVFYETRETGSRVHRAFPLLGISITAIFIAIQFSLPLSLGLLGALSIVRFRTPIKEPEEIGFVMLVVAAALSCATFNLIFLGIILLIAVLALVGARLGRRILGERLDDGMLVATLPRADYRAKGELLLGCLEGGLPRARVDAVSESGDEAVVSCSFSRLSRAKLSEVQKRLAELSGELRLDVFFNRSPRP